MRSRVVSRRIGMLMNASCLTVVAGVLAGCSSGFERFDYLSAATPQPSNVSNPYPDGIDPTTTASVGGLRPAANVGVRATPQAVYHQAEPRYVAQQTTPAYQAPQSYQPVRQNLSSYKPTPAPQYSRAISRSWSNSSNISSASLSKPEVKAAAAPVVAKVAQPVVQKVQTYVPPKPSPNEVYIAPQKVDNLTTAAIAPKPYSATASVATAATTLASNRRDGWQSTGGTNVTTRPGETLYNMSKRYGVPVDAIRKANGMKSTDSLQVGQQILIPNYVFSPTSAISAPDSNPETRASRASTGYIGQADGLVGVPTRRPYQSGTLAPHQVVTSTRGIAPTVEPLNEMAPDRSIITGSTPSSSSVYVVKAGDTLSKISGRQQASVNAIMAANQLKNTNIWVGQKLLIPNGKQSVPGTDNTVTQSVILPTPAEAITQAKKQDVTPASTGISQFRWPVSGRVISGFGSKSGTQRNDGIDISVPEGTAVKAAENGVVIYAGEEISVYGKLILVRHADDWVSAYAHNRDFEVSKGDQVRRGQIIARSGQTGETDRPKVHFELRKNSNPVDPKKYLSKS